MILSTPLPEQLVSAIAEGSISGHFAVAQFVVAALCHIKSHRSAPGQDPLALPIAHWVDLAVSTRAPIVGFSTAEVHVGGENTGVRGHAGWSVAALLIGARLSQVNHRLLREVSHIVHRLNVPLCYCRLQNDRVVKEDISLISIQFATNGAMRGRELDRELD